MAMAHLVWSPDVGWDGAGVDTQAAETIIAIATWYGIAGAVLAVLFLAVGLNRIDPAGHGSYLFRLLLLPGLVLIWPIVLLRWIALERRKAG